MSGPEAGTNFRTRLRTRLADHLSSSGARIVAAILAIAVIVAAVAFSGSYQHQYELGVQYGQAHWVAGMQPLSVEGLIAAATLAIWYAASVLKLSAWRAWGAYLMLAAGIGQSTLMNLAADHHYNWPWLGPEISVWPAVAFVGSYELGVWIARKSARRRTGTASAPALSENRSPAQSVKATRPAKRTNERTATQLPRAAAATARAAEKNRIVNLVRQLVDGGAPVPGERSLAADYCGGSRRMARDVLADLAASNSHAQNGARP
jgi:hypothetical protein